MQAPQGLQGAADQAEWFMYTFKTKPCTVVSGGSPRRNRRSAQAAATDHQLASARQSFHGLR
jgi:hypothetical protein